jgi:Protein of unknown function (DUF3515)
VGVRGVCFRTAARVLALLAALLLTSCADGPVTLDSPPVSEGDYDTCTAFLDDLPRRLDGKERRKVNPAAALGRAWGDPAIIVRCGVEVPPEFDRLAGCEVADDVGWFVPQSVIDDQGADATYTAVGYRPIVQVDVPHDYRPEGGAAVIAELADAVKAHLELVDECE